MKLCSYSAYTHGSDALCCNIVTKKVKCFMANICHALSDYANRYQVA